MWWRFFADTESDCIRDYYSPRLEEGEHMVRVIFLHMHGVVPYPTTQITSMYPKPTEVQNYYAISPTLNHGCSTSATYCYYLYLKDYMKDILQNSSRPLTANNMTDFSQNSIHTNIFLKMMSSVLGNDRLYLSEKTSVEGVLSIPIEEAFYHLYKVDSDNWYYKKHLTFDDHRLIPSFINFVFNADNTLNTDKTRRSVYIPTIIQHMELSMFMSLFYFHNPEKEDADLFQDFLVDFRPFLREQEGKSTRLFANTWWEKSVNDQLMEGNILKKNIPDIIDIMSIPQPRVS